MGRRLREVDLGAWTGLDRADAKTRFPHEYELAVDDTARGEEALTGFGPRRLCRPAPQRSPPSPAAVSQIAGQ